MTKNKIVIFISIVIAGCFALGIVAFRCADGLAQGYRDAGKMEWSLKLSNKYTAIYSSDFTNEFVFSIKSPEFGFLDGIMKPNGQVVISPAEIVIPAGDGWYSIGANDNGPNPFEFTYKNINGLTKEGWTFTDQLYFRGDYAIVTRSDGTQMVMNKKGEFIRTLKTKKETWMLSGDCYGMYDKKTKLLQVLDIKTDKVVYESRKYERIVSLREDGYVAYTHDEEASTNILGKNFEPLFGRKTFNSRSITYRDGILLAFAGTKKHPEFHYLDIKNNREVMKVPKEVIGAYPFSEGMAILYTRSKSFAIDTHGKVVFEKPYKLNPTLSSEIQLFGEGESDTGLVGMGIFGKFSGGFAPLTPDGVHWGYVNKSGEYVVKPIFEMADNPNEGYGAVYFKGMWGILDLKKCQ